MKNLLHFNEICENILTEKQHSFLHNLRPFARKKRYIEEDFLDIWNESCFKKFKAALTGVNLHCHLYEIPDKNRDIFQGTSTPGVFLRYKINEDAEKNIIKNILEKLKDNKSSNDDLGYWRAYIEEDLATCENEGKAFHLPMEMQIVARIKPKANQSFQSEKPMEISQFNEAGFKGNIYLWFDFEKYKVDIKDIIDKQKKSEFDITTEQQQAPSDTEDIELSKPHEDKILIGDFNIDIKDSDKKGILELGKSILNGSYVDILDTKISKGINRLLGSGDKKDQSEDPDIIRKKIVAGSVEKPFIEVNSIVNLKDWLYSYTEDPEKKYLGKDMSKRSIASIQNIPFNENNVKKEGNILAKGLDISTNNCWHFGNIITNWNQRIPVTLDKLKLSENKNLTFMFQAWAKKQNGIYYLMYIIQLDLDAYGHLKESIDRLTERIRILENNIKNTEEHFKDKPDKIAGQTHNDRTSLDSANRKLTELNKQFTDFNTWLKTYWEQSTNGTFNVKAYSDNPIKYIKQVYNNKNEVIVAGKAENISNLYKKDINAYNYIYKILFDTHWTCNGESVSDILELHQEDSN